MNASELYLSVGVIVLVLERLTDLTSGLLKLPSRVVHPTTRWCDLLENNTATHHVKNGEYVAVCMSNLLALRLFCTKYSFNVVVHIPRHFI